MSDAMIERARSIDQGQRGSIRPWAEALLAAYDALRKYGDHLPGCFVNSLDYRGEDEGEVCTCGFAGVLP